MKSTILLALTTVLFISCEKQDTRYTQQSAEIDTYKKVIQNYKNLNWEDMATHYADTAKIANNVTKENAVSLSEAIKTQKEDAEMFTWVVEDEEYEMVVTDDNETWVNFWATWKGTMKSTKKLYTIPVHNTVQFVNGKIVQEFGYWNNSEIVTDLLIAEQELAESTIDETEMNE